MGAVDEVSDVFEEEFKDFARPVTQTRKYIVSEGRLNITDAVTQSENWRKHFVYRG